MRQAHVIQTFWSLPRLCRDAPVVELLELTTMMLSSLNLRRLFAKPRLYCDSHFNGFLLRHGIGHLWDIDSHFLEEIPDAISSRDFPTFGKVWVMCAQGEPFLHVDGDFIPFESMKFSSLRDHRAMCIHFEYPRGQWYPGWNQYGLTLEGLVRDRAIQLDDTAMVPNTSFFEVTDVTWLRDYKCAVDDLIPQLQRYTGTQSFHTLSLLLDQRLIGYLLAPHDLGVWSNRIWDPSRGAFTPMEQGGDLAGSYHHTWFRKKELLNNWPGMGRSFSLWCLAQVHEHPYADRMSRSAARYFAELLRGGSRELPL